MQQSWGIHSKFLVITSRKQQLQKVRKVCVSFHENDCYEYSENAVLIYHDFMTIQALFEW